MKQRRGAEEWRRLVQDWKRSGETAARFAKRRGLSARTLVWWAWRLRQSSPSTKRGRRSKKREVTASRAVQLVPVEIEPIRSDGDGGPSDAELVWELAAPSGHVLRVLGSGAMRALDEALVAVTRIDRQR